MSREVNLATVLLMLLASAMPAPAQDQQLKGLTGVRVVVEFPDLNTGPAKEAIRRNSDAIQTDVELRLREAGMRVLATDQRGTRREGPMLAVSVTEFATATHVIVELHENVFLERNPAMKVFATTWRCEGVHPSPDVQKVRYFIKDAVDRFLNSWLAMNPR